jgi:hypothetical protein
MPQQIGCPDIRPLGPTVEGRDARTETANKQHVKWQAEAGIVWRKNKKLSLTAVAKHIAPNNWNYVRQLIRKPKK